MTKLIKEKGRKERKSKRAESPAERLPFAIGVDKVDPTLVSLFASSVRRNPVADPFDILTLHLDTGRSCQAPLEMPLSYV
jgi:hypothetical protein